MAYSPPLFGGMLFGGMLAAGLDVADSISEAATAADAPDAAVESAAVIAEAANAVDSPSAATLTLADVTEAANATDTPAASVSVVASVAEPATAADAVSAALTAAAALSEGAAAADAPAGAATFVVSVIETGSALALDITNAEIGLPKIILIAEVVRPNSDRCIIAATSTTIYRYNHLAASWGVIGTGFSPLGKRWQAVLINGWIVLNNGVDLPVSYRVEDSAVIPLYELREVGVASVGWITHYNGFLFAMNVVTIIDAQLAAVMSGPAPYGQVNAALTNHIPYRVIWSEFGEPRNWAPVFKFVLNASTATFTLPFASSLFVANVTRVAVINGGPENTTLGGDIAHPDGVLVTSVVGNVITLEIPTDAATTYPREVQITRWTDLSAITGYKDLQGDATEILGGKALHSVLVIYRDKGIYVARYTGNPEDPFDWKERVPGTPNVPIWMEALATVGDDEYHLYPGNGKYFFAFDGVNPPTVHAVMDETRRRFFAGLDDASDVWAVNNTLTQESWFCRPGFTVAFDYVKKTAAEIDAEIEAAAIVTKPGEDFDIFLMAIASRFQIYGRELGVPTTFHRNGVNPGGRLIWGRGVLTRDSFNESRLRSYQMQFSSVQTEIAMRLKLYSAHSASAARTELTNEVIAHPAETGNMIPMHFQGLYFQDEIHIEGVQDVDVRFIGRLLEESKVRSAGVTRNA